MAPLGLQMTTLGSLGGQPPLWEIQRSNEWWYTPGLHMAMDDGSGNKDNYQGPSSDLFTGLGEVWLQPNTTEFRADWGGYTESNRHGGYGSRSSGSSNVQNSDAQIELIGWYKHNTGLTMSTIDGVAQCVTQWEDQSHYNNHLIAEDLDSGGSIDADEVPIRSSDFSLKFGPSSSLKFTNAHDLDSYTIVIRMSLDASKSYPFTIFKNADGSNYISAHNNNEFRVHTGDSVTKKFPPYDSSDINPSGYAHIPPNGGVAGRNAFTITVARTGYPEPLAAGGYAQMAYYQGPGAVKYGLRGPFETPYIHDGTSYVSYPGDVWAEYSVANNFGRYIEYQNAATPDPWFDTRGAYQYNANVLTTSSTTTYDAKKADSSGPLHNLNLTHLGGDLDGAYVYEILIYRGWVNYSGRHLVLNSGNTPNIGYPWSNPGSMADYNTFIVAAYANITNPTYFNTSTLPGIMGYMSGIANNKIDTP